MTGQLMVILCTKFSFIKTNYMKTRLGYPLWARQPRSNFFGRYKNLPSGWKMKNLPIGWTMKNLPIGWKIKRKK